MSDSYRPAFHFTPLSMWLNDPNGLVYYAGEYHLFYQYHPHSTVWGPMHWGHAVSKDLIYWEHLPIALYPDENGLIFSGSAVIDWNNTAGFGKEAMVAIFTYNNHTYDDKKRVEDQNIAYSTDHGLTWTKYAGNPVVPHPGNLTDFRDPKVFWHKDHWVMALAAGDWVLFYISPDLKHWESSGSFGGGYGSTSGVWETPDLFQLPLNGSDSRWVLTVGVGSGAYAGGSGTQYFVGDFDGKTFTSENPKETVLWMDHGPDFYAPQSWNDEPNGRRISIAWMSNWSYARETPTETWRGMLTMPRELSLTQTSNGLRLLQKPIVELAYLRRDHIHWQDEVITPKHNLLAGIQSRSLEIDAEIAVLNATKRFGIRIFVGEGEETIIYYQPEESLLYLDRSRSGQVDFHEDFSRLQSVPLSPVGGSIRLRILVDRCSVEVFANDGSVTLTDCVFPSAQSHGLKFFVEEGYLHLNSLDIYFLEHADFNITSIK
ncbi:MAG: glycoside hydrolase family 32 protein [Anaerolineales bacterium]|uniref:glycoside hydrolase family 32 protein n=1 Tax=Candidatus Villigracilis vicinus TaxID=3140679 RepID=UPI00313607C6|nr:glycoside hydrolase family 32 protein [Anaerolineales bacterium]